MSGFRLSRRSFGDNGNAITVSLGSMRRSRGGGGRYRRPDGVGARLAERADARAEIEPLTFGMTFPFSTHNYQLRFWMAAAGVDPDEDVRLVVLPPPYMVESLTNGQLDGFASARHGIR